MMMIRYAIAVALGLSSIGALAAAQADNGPPRWMANMVRHQHVIMEGVPRPYANVHDTTRDTPAKLRHGAEIFRRECAACHGTTGEGAGPEAFAMVPVPADLEWLARKPEKAAEPYIYWSIAEGGETFGSEMPAYKSSLSPKEIWALVAYIRSGFPDHLPRTDARK